MIQENVKRILSELPQAVTLLEREIKQLEIERQALLQDLSNE